MNIVVHQGAIGDWVLTFPLLRALPGPTLAVAQPSKAALAARLLDQVSARDVDQADYWRLHMPGGHKTVSPARREEWAQARQVISFVSNGRDAWADNVRRLAPGARCYFVTPRPPRQWREHVTRWHAHQLAQQGLNLGPPPPITLRDDGPIVIHPGSGGRNKCWPPRRFERLIEALRDRGQAPQVCMGEVETDTWPANVLESWMKSFGARVTRTLEELHTLLLGAGVFIGNDAGPTHLAAQMGVPTVALFGPTFATTWAPIGPAVRVLAPPGPAAMTWLDVDVVLEAVIAARRCSP